MKKIVTTFFILFVAKIGFAQAYLISVKAKGYTKGLTYFTYYNGSNLNIQDSGIIKKDGSITFAGKTKLLGGIYVLVLPDRRRVDFLIDKEQKIRTNTEFKIYEKNKQWGFRGKTLKSKEKNKYRVYPVYGDETDANSLEWWLIYY